MYHQGGQGRHGLVNMAEPDGQVGGLVQQRHPVGLMGSAGWADALVVPGHTLLAICGHFVLVEGVREMAQVTTIRGRSRVKT